MASLRSRIKSLAESAAEPALSLPEISPRSRLIDAVKETRKRQSLKDKAEEQRSAVVSAYLFSMDAHPDLGAVQEEAMVALCHLIAKGNGIRTLVKTGGVDSIVLAMRLHVKSANIQQKGSTALSQVAVVDGPCRAAIVAADGVSALVEAMNHHGSTAGVLERCCTALAAIAGGDSVCKAACVNAGVVPAVVSAMTEFLRRGTMQIGGATLLSHLAAGEEELRIGVASSGGLIAVCDGMREHGGLLQMQQIGCQCLHNMSRGSLHCIQGICEADGLKRCVCACRWYPTQPFITHLVAGVFANLGQIEAARGGGGGGGGSGSAGGSAGPSAIMREVLDVHAIPALIHAIDRHKTKAPVAERGLAAFGNLLLSGGGLAAAQAVRHRGLDLVSDCMRSHSKNMHILLQACNCYINAAAVSLEVKEVIATNPQVRTQHSISQAPQHRTHASPLPPSPHTHLQGKGRRESIRDTIPPPTR